MTIGLERTRYDVDEGEIVEVCAVLISGTLQREAVVTLQTMDGSATGLCGFVNNTTELNIHNMYTYTYSTSGLYLNHCGPDV